MGGPHTLVLVAVRDVARILQFHHVLPAVQREVNNRLGSLLHVIVGAGELQQLSETAPSASIVESIVDDIVDRVMFSEVPSRRAEVADMQRAEIRQQLQDTQTALRESEARVHQLEGELKKHIAARESMMTQLFQEIAQLRQLRPGDPHPHPPSSPSESRAVSPNSGSSPPTTASTSPTLPRRPSELLYRIPKARCAACGDVGAVFDYERYTAMFQEDLRSWPLRYAAMQEELEKRLNDAHMERAMTVNRFAADLHQSETAVRALTARNQSLSYLVEHFRPVVLNAVRATQKPLREQLAALRKDMRTLMNTFVGDLTAVRNKLNEVEQRNEFLLQYVQHCVTRIFKKLQLVVEGHRVSATQGKPLWQYLLLENESDPHADAKGFWQSHPPLQGLTDLFKEVLSLIQQVSDQKQLEETLTVDRLTVDGSDEEEVEGGDDDPLVQTQTSSIFGRSFGGNESRTAGGSSSNSHRTAAAAAGGGNSSINGWPFRRASTSAAEVGGAAAALVSPRSVLSRSGNRAPSASSPSLPPSSRGGARRQSTGGKRPTPPQAPSTGSGVLSHVRVPTSLSSPEVRKGEEAMTTLTRRSVQAKLRRVVAKIRRGIFLRKLPIATQNAIVELRQLDEDVTRADQQVQRCATQFNETESQVRQTVLRHSLHDGTLYSAVLFGAEKFQPKQLLLPDGGGGVTIPVASQRSQADAAASREIRVRGGNDSAMVMRPIHATTMPPSSTGGSQPTPEPSLLNGRPLPSYVYCTPQPVLTDIGVDDDDPDCTVFRIQAVGQRGGSSSNNEKLPELHVPTVTMSTSRPLSVRSRQLYTHEFQLRATSPLHHALQFVVPPVPVPATPSRLSSRSGQRRSTPRGPSGQSTPSIQLQRTNYDKSLSLAGSHTAR